MEVNVLLENKCITPERNAVLTPKGIRYRDREREKIRKKQINDNMNSRHP